MVKGVDDGIRQLSAIAVDDLNSGVFPKDQIKRVAPHFEGTFKTLLRVMSLQDIYKKPWKGCQARKSSRLDQ